MGFFAPGGDIDAAENVVIRGPVVSAGLARRANADNGTGRGVRAVAGDGRGTMIEALIFDMDGLLVDSEPLAARAMDDFLARYGFERRAEIHEQLLGRRLPEALAIVKAGYAMEHPIEELIERYGELRLAALRGVVAPMPGAGEIIAFGRGAGLKLALATSGMRAHADLSLTETGLAGRFDAEVTGDEVAKGKPAPDLFLLAAERLGVEPAACIVFEDAPAGVMAAKAAGMRVVAVPTELNRDHVVGLDPDAVVPDLHAAIPWLRAQGVHGRASGVVKRVAFELIVIRAMSRDLSVPNVLRCRALSERRLRYAPGDPSTSLGKTVGTRFSAAWACSR